MPTYLDSSALVKLAVREPESAALRAYVRRRRAFLSSALCRTEVARATLPFGQDVVRRARDVVARVELVRVNDRVLDLAGELMPLDLRSLDAIHLATALLAAGAGTAIVTYDGRMAKAAKLLGLRPVAPK